MFAVVCASSPLAVPSPQQCIPSLCEMLSPMDPKIAQVALNGLENILRVGEADAKITGHNQYALLVEECCGECSSGGAGYCESILFSNLDPEQ